MTQIEEVSEELKSGTVHSQFDIH
ncbi:hypothetical protein CGCSCA4_v001946 [Colletotrichum siamense]|uniref:Uncharacterized protein n=2 Tax=Colletotrichum siamense TaxID=690259 RepID=A0A9P5K9C8_COLSI|nr:hypothetical protein CGCSCA4_v001946 [Colletotrichum siamense]KAF4864569.1 hypothetical protein CGCSCA2_v002082 [Colletotrichum siamense]